MASTYTSNIGLEKPNGNDDISVLAINGNSDKLDARDIASVFAAGESNFQAASIALYNCTGTIDIGLRYHVAGNLCLIEGRLSITDYVRTGANPGFTIYFPNSKKAKKRVNIEFAGITANANGFRAGENARFIVYANSPTFKIDTTESYNNFGNSARATYQIFPIIVELIS